MKRSTLWFGLYFLLTALYSVFTYALTDPNLVLSTWKPYWDFQQWMWGTFFNNSVLLTQVYVLLVSLLMVCWWKVVKHTATSSSRKKVLFKAVLLCLPLLFSYNALSHDVFNYIFNAKMVMVYQENPHVSVALNHATDPWTRFMHNTHTPAPYGYGWTMFSLLPYLLGFNVFSLTWFLFRLLNLSAVPLLFVLICKIGERLRVNVTAKNLAVVFLSPLLLIEVISNSHNDLWMLIPAIASLWLISEVSAKQFSSRVILSVLLFVASISTKLATVVLLPLWLFSLWRVVILNTTLLSWVPRLLQRAFDTGWALTRSNLGLFSSILLFLPLLTERSQYFHPWYLLWSFIWIPLIQVRWWKNILLALAVSSLLRYVPWLLSGGFEGSVLVQQQAVTWLGGMVILGMITVWQKITASTHEKK
jgi:hypothetical protein